MSRPELLELRSGVSFMIDAAERVNTLVEQRLSSIHKQTDRMFRWLLVAKWVAAIAVALWISPYSVVWAN